MSWDTLSETNETCPCGRGTYKITRKCDDWGRLEEIWSMDCTLCSEKYQLEVNHVKDRDGIINEVKQWKLN